MVVASAGYMGSCMVGGACRVICGVELCSFLYDPWMVRGVLLGLWLGHCFLVSACIVKGTILTHGIIMAVSLGGCVVTVGP